MNVNRSVFDRLGLGGSPMRVQELELPIESLESAEFHQVLDLWEQLRGDRFAPSWRAADLMRLPGKIVPFICIADVQTEPEDYIYRFWGTGHTEVKGIDNTGKSVAAHDPEELGQAIFGEYRRVVSERVPLAFRHDLYPELRHAAMYQDTIRLPLSADGETVTQVLSYADWRSRWEEWQRIFQEMQVDRA